MADYIDRDAALEAVWEADSLELATHGANRIADRIRALPAVNPAAIRAAALTEIAMSINAGDDALAIKWRILALIQKGDTNV